ncbi:hypothetical protein Tco_1294547 [Tanacetum coccineum]
MSPMALSDSENVSTGAPIIEDWESDSDDEKKPKSKVEKKTGVSKTISPTVSNIEFVRPKQQEKPACWVWRPIKPNSPCITFEENDYVMQEEEPVLNGMGSQEGLIFLLHGKDPEIK